MEVILLQDVEKLGDKNDLVKVKPGFGRNYLIPNGMAVVANSSNKKMWAERVKQEERRADERREELEALAAKLKGTILKVGAKVGTSGKIFGSVTNVQLADALKKQQDLTVDRKKITLPEEIKSLGTYTAQVVLHKDLTVDVQFEVVGE